MKKYREHTQQLNIRLPDEMHKLLLEMAIINQLTISQQVREILGISVKSYRSNRDAE